MNNNITFQEASLAEKAGDLMDSLRDMGGSSRDIDISDSNFDPASIDTMHTGIYRIAEIEGDLFHKWFDPSSHTPNDRSMPLIIDMRMLIKFWELDGYFIWGKPTDAGLIKILYECFGLVANYPHMNSNSKLEEHVYRGVTFYTYQRYIGDYQYLNLFFVLVPLRLDTDIRGV